MSFRFLLRAPLLLIAFLTFGLIQLGLRTPDLLANASPTSSELHTVESHRTNEIIFGVETPTPSPPITPTPFAGPLPYPIGDVTCDHVVNLADVLDLLRRAAGLENRPACPPPVPAAFLQYDGSSVSLHLDPHFSYVHSGSEFAVSLQADTGGGSLGAYRAFVSYDQRKLTAISCSVTCNLAWSDDTIALDGISVSGWTGTVTLASISFKAIGGPGNEVAVALTADQLTDELGNPIADCVSSGAEFRIDLPLAPASTTSSSDRAQGYPTATPSPTPSPTPTPVPTPPPPSPTPCDRWLPASLGCDEPVRPIYALWVLYNIAFPGVGYPTCPTHGGK